MRFFGPGGVFFSYMASERDGSSELCSHIGQGMYPE